MNPETNKPLALLSALEAPLNGIRDVAVGLRDDIHNAELERKRANKINLSVSALLALLLVAVLVVGFRVNASIEENRKTNEQISDCTTPGGECAQESQRRTESAVGAITKISIYVSQCGRLYPGLAGPEYDAKIEACVAERLRRLATPGPSPAPSPSPSTSGGA